MSDSPHDHQSDHIRPNHTDPEQPGFDWGKVESTDQYGQPIEENAALLRSIRARDVQSYYSTAESIALWVNIIGGGAAGFVIGYFGSEITVEGAVGLLACFVITLLIESGAAWWSHGERPNLPIVAFKAVAVTAFLLLFQYAISFKIRWSPGLENGLIFMVIGAIVGSKSAVDYARRNRATSNS